MTRETRIVFMPVKDFAEKHNVTVQTVYNWVKDDKVLVKKIGTYTLVAEKP